MSETTHLIYLLTKEGQQGPYTLGQVQELHQSGSLSQETQVWQTETASWVPVNQVFKTQPPIGETTQQTHLATSAPQVQVVVVGDIRMKFFSMVWFMVKWAFAAIPATLIIMTFTFGLIVLFIMLLGLLGVGLGTAMAG